MEAIEIGAFRGKALIDVSVVALVVSVGGLREARGIDQLSIQLRGAGQGGGGCGGDGYCEVHTNG